MQSVFRGYGGAVLNVWSAFVRTVGVVINQSIIYLVNCAK